MSSAVMSAWRNDPRSSSPLIDTHIARWEPGPSNSDISASYIGLAWGVLLTSGQHNFVKRLAGKRKYRRY